MEESKYVMGVDHYPDVYSEVTPESDLELLKDYIRQSKDLDWRLLWGEDAAVPGGLDKKGEVRMIPVPEDESRRLRGMAFRLYESFPKGSEQRVEADIFLAANKKEVSA